MGSLDAGGDFLVTIKSQSLVASPLPNLRIQEEQCLPLSNVDLTLPAVEFSVFFCFRKPETNTFSCMVDVLKKALAQVLEWYCVLSGEMILNSQQEPQVLCNNRGVDFIEAYADVELKHLPLHNPDVSVKGKLVPKNNQGVFCVQVTELKCGGLVVACKFDHRIADANAGCLFLVSWAEKSKLQPLSRYPSFQRSLLKPHKVANFNDAYLDNMYTPLSMIPPPSSPKQAEHASRIYYITAENISRIQSDANFPGCHNITKLQSFSVYLWQLIAKGVPEGIKKCNMGIVVDGRTRIVSDVKEFKSSPMSSYFGNVISVPYGEMGINELKTKSLPCIAEEVHKFLEVALTPNHFYGVIDWVEAHRPELTLPAIYCKDTKEEVSFVVSSGLRFPFAEVDFGWGKPIFGSCHLAWDAMVGYVMPMQSPSRKGDWVVYMYLLKEQLESLEAEAGDVFRPLTMEYLSSQ